MLNYLVPMCDTEAFEQNVKTLITALMVCVWVFVFGCVHVFISH